MREDYLEKLDIMFPDGYVIVYSCSDNQLRLNMYNPYKDETIFKYHDLIKDVTR